MIKKGLDPDVSSVLDLLNGKKFVQRITQNSKLYNQVISTISNQLGIFKVRPTCPSEKKLWYECQKIANKMPEQLKFNQIIETEQVVTKAAENPEHKYWAIFQMSQHKRRLEYIKPKPNPIKIEFTKLKRDMIFNMYNFKYYLFYHLRMHDCINPDREHGNILELKGKVFHYLSLEVKRIMEVLSGQTQKRISRESWEANYENYLNLVICLKNAIRPDLLLYNVPNHIKKPILNNYLNEIDWTNKIKRYLFLKSELLKKKKYTQFKKQQDFANYVKLEDNEISQAILNLIQLQKRGLKIIPAETKTVVVRVRPPSDFHIFLSQNNFYKSKLEHHMHINSKENISTYDLINLLFIRHVSSQTHQQISKRYIDYVKHKGTNWRYRNNLYRSINRILYKKTHRLLEIPITNLINKSKNKQT
jgi:hypothetical protein